MIKSSAMTFGADGLATQKTGDNGNQALVELTDLDPSHADNFMYSIHHVFPKGSLTKDEVIHYESLLKDKIGTN